MMAPPPEPFSVIPVLMHVAPLPSMPLHTVWGIGRWALSRRLAETDGDRTHHTPYRRVLVLKTREATKIRSVFRTEGRLSGGGVRGDKSNGARLYPMCPCGRFLPQSEYLASRCSSSRAR